MNQPNCFCLVLPLILKGATIVGSKKYIKKATEKLIESGADLAAILLVEFDMSSIDTLLSMSNKEFKGFRNTIKIPQIREALANNYRITKSEYDISYTDRELSESFSTDNWEKGTRKVIDELFLIRRKIGENHVLGFIVVDVQIKDKGKVNYVKIMLRSIVHELVESFPAKR